MSYILEALQKSEYARQQGKVPDLTTVALPPAGTGAEAPERRWAWLAAIAAVAAALGALGAIGPWQPATEGPAPAADPAASPMTAARAPLASAPSASVPTASAPSASATPASAPSATPSLVSLPPASHATPGPGTPQATAPLAAPSRQVPQAAPQPEAKTPLAVAPAPPRADTPTEGAPRPPAVQPSPTPRPDRILSLQELPAQIRNALPALKVSGYSYAEGAETPMAVINDRLVQEGDEAAPGVTVVRIASDGVVLAYEGLRFRP